MFTNQESLSYLHMYINSECPSELNVFNCLKLILIPQRVYAYWEKQVLDKRIESLSMDHLAAMLDRIHKPTFQQVQDI